MMESALKATTSMGTLTEARTRGEAAMSKLGGAATDLRPQSPIVSVGPTQDHFMFWADEHGTVATTRPEQEGVDRLTAEDCAELSGMFDALARILLVERQKADAVPAPMPGEAA